MNRQVVVSVAAGLLVGLAVGRYTANILPPEGSLVWVDMPRQAGGTETPAVAGAKEKAPQAEVAPAVEGSADGTVMDRTMPSMGPADAPVLMVEMSDFQCPFCSKAEPTIDALMRAYPKQIRRVWANNPLPFHDHAMKAALAGVAAQRQGKFWALHDKLFAGQEDLSDARMEGWAQEIGLNMEKFRADLKDPAVQAQVKREMRATKALGAEGTPGFLINGRLIEGAVPIEQFKAAVDAALEVAKTPAVMQEQGFARLEAAMMGFEPEKGPKVLEYFVLGAEPPEGGDVQEDPLAGDGAVPMEGGEMALPAGAKEVWRLTLREGDAIRGDSDKALVTIVEVSDFECPFCAQLSSGIDDLQARYGDKVRVVFKHFPLADLHPGSKEAHAASIAAAEQGKFWKFHDLLFENQDKLNDAQYRAWAKELGLDVARFDRVRKSAKTAKRIEDDLDLGRSLRVDGTPHTFINGRKIAGAVPVELIEGVVKEEIAKAETLGKRGASYYNEIVSKGKILKSLADKVNRFDLSKLPALGQKKAPHTLVVFSDFQCPYSKKIADELKAVQRAHPRKLRLLFAHYPLPFHEHALPAHVLAQEAFAQGGSKLFWAVHDALFAAQEELSKETIEKVGVAAGMDMKAYALAVADKRHERFIEATVKQGQEAGVEGTPNLYIDGRRFIPMAPSLELALKAVLPDL